MPTYAVQFHILTFLGADEVESEDRKFRMWRSKPEALLDRAEVEVEAESPEEARVVARKDAEFYLGIAAYQNDGRMELLSDGNIREIPQGYMEVSIIEQFQVADHPIAETLKNTNDYLPLRQALSLYSEALVLQNAAPAYAFLSYYKIVELLTSKRAPGFHGDRKVHHWLSTWKVLYDGHPISLSQVRKLDNIRNKSAHSVIKKPRLRISQAAMLEIARDLPVIRSIARRCMEHVRNNP